MKPRLFLILLLCRGFSFQDTNTTSFIVNNVLTSWFFKSFFAVQIVLLSIISFHKWFHQLFFSAWNIRSIRDYFIKKISICVVYILYRSIFFPVNKHLRYALPNTFHFLYFYSLCSLINNLLVVTRTMFTMFVVVVCEFQVFSLAYEKSQEFWMSIIMFPPRNKED